MRHREAEIIKAWQRGWTYHENMSHSREEAIAHCPYSRSYPELRKEWISGWDEASAQESELFDAGKASGYPGRLVSIPEND